MSTVVALVDTCVAPTSFALGVVLARSRRYRHTHTWDDGTYTHTPPRTTPVSDKERSKLLDFGQGGLLMNLEVGFTTICKTCTSCGKVEITRDRGKIEPRRGFLETRSEG